MNVFLQLQIEEVTKDSRFLSGRNDFTVNQYHLLSFEELATYCELTLLLHRFRCCVRMNVNAFWIVTYWQYR